MEPASKKILLVGLTGPVAAGKSLVAAEFVRLGAYLIDADVVAREVVAKDTPAYREIAVEFGPGILASDGSINRKTLGKVIFGDPAARAVLNGITHPRIRARITELIGDCRRQGDRPLIVVDAALLIENELCKAMDKVIVVSAGEPTLIRRIFARDGLNEADAKARLAAQMPLEEKKRYADYVVDNNGPIERTLEAVQRIYAELTAAPKPTGQGCGG